ncbi:MAG TPA: hypothetical protein VK688_10350 [Gemmatimonadales bacterium]|nr:hypothetical protein [Gemmatimonadales bacterium]
MNDLLAVVLLGFFLGMRHATDPDHVIAVTTIVARQRSARGAALIGAVWGVGHTLTILLVGSGIILFRWAIPDRIGLSMEFAVGVMLVVLGVANLRDVWGLVRGRPGGSPVRVAEPGSLRSSHTHSHDSEHSHAHSHGDYVHSHSHSHAPERHPHAPDQTPIGWLDRHFGGVELYQLVRPLVVGIVHGLAGSAAVALLVLAAIGNPRWSVLYLLVFGLGTIVGMMVITAAIALPFALSASQSRVAGRLRVASGLVSVAFGCFIIYQMGVVHGLFTSHPQWTPS